ncbi:hypothetical protein HMPREF1981_03188 [Bacteroides pyogenes F0041]|uniref:Uncharacterized protein n=2 Tax=Bacteroides pyogenes TaxID=310300 RepID=U2BTA6_9BACE|nr:hypothetical protein HMPREF1981_03188 [Bacteroides pyogenes F0041]
MSKAPKFMIAKNKMADPNSVYIYHSQKPRMLLKIEPGGVRVVDDIDSYKEFYKGDPEKIKGLFNRLSDWYRAYVHNARR